MRSLILPALVLVPLLSADAAAQQPKQGAAKSNYPPVLKNAKAEVYRTVGDVRLNIYIFQPQDHKADDRRPAIVFFFGGGWRGGSPQQFEKQCEYLASRGMVACTADYRVSTRHGVKAVDCVADAMAAVRWVRANAARLGVDPERIAAGGGSAGGHLAACTGTLDGINEPGQNAEVSARPNAMVLFNPAVVLAPVEGLAFRRDLKELKERTGVDPAAISPYHHVKPGAPPTLILHGKADSTVPYDTVEHFTAAMHKAGNRCELAGYDGASHGFFNFGRANNKAFAATLDRVDRFLASLGYLSGDPEVGAFLRGQGAAKN